MLALNKNIHIWCQWLEMFYLFIFGCFYYSCDIVYCFFFYSFIDGEFFLSIKTVIVWAEMLFYKYWFVAIHRFDSVFV